MRIFRVSLHISTEQLLQYYQGSVSAVVAKTHQGLSIQFPVHHLRPFTQRSGIHGVFEITIDGESHLHSIKKVS